MFWPVPVMRSAGNLVWEICLAGLRFFSNELDYAVMLKGVFYLHQCYQASSSVAPEHIRQVVWVT